MRGSCRGPKRPVPVWSGMLRRCNLQVRQRFETLGLRYSVDYTAKLSGRSRRYALNIFWKHWIDDWFSQRLQIIQQKVHATDYYTKFPVTWNVPFSMIVHSFRFNVVISLTMFQGYRSGWCKVEFFQVHQNFTTTAVSRLMMEPSETLRWNLYLRYER